jgi:predicted ATPase
LPTDRRHVRSGLLAAGLAALLAGCQAPDTVPLLASFLSVPIPPRYPPLDLTPQSQKQKTLEALVDILAGMAERQPVLFAVEDLHWIDPSSLELLNLVVARVPAARILAVFLFRPTFESPWAEGENVTRDDLRGSSRARPRR